MVAREYPRGLPLTDKRIYDPKPPLPSTNPKAKWVGKEVTVRWSRPVFSLAGWAKDPRTGELVALNYINWYAWVPELNSYVPESDFVSVKRKK